MSATYRFLPYVRQGAAAGLNNPDDLGPVLNARLDLPLSLRLNNRPETQVAMTLRRQGPGDVTGLDARAIIRTDPPHGTPAFEPNYFPLIEFDRPDFPWLFTPASTGSQGRLRPWLVLVAVRRQEGVRLTFQPDRRLPVLSIQDPARPGVELPDLAESWAWAHSQVIEAEPGLKVAQLLLERPRLNLSRLICPRRLVPNARYLACLVPAFEAGRLAGLGMEVSAAEESALRPAWLSGASAPDVLLLPVYYSWEFSTGLGGDFESLVRQLAARPLPPGVGQRPLQVSRLGFGMPDLGTVRLEGALRPPGPPVVLSQPAKKIEAFQKALRSLLNLPERLHAGGQLESDPVVAPPIYGSLPSARFELPDKPAEGDTQPDGEQREVWLEDLNLDPRHRVAAGLGVSVVQDQQELLVAAAWAGLGDGLEAARLLRHLPFARTVLTQVHQKRLAPLPPERLLQLTGPLHARVRLSPETLLARLKESAMPEAASSAAFRRVLRPNGPLLRRVAPQGAPRVASRLVRRLSSSPVAVIFRTVPHTGALAPQDTATQIGIVRTRLQTAEAGGQASPATRRYLDAYQALQDYAASPPLQTLPGPRPQFEFDQVGEQLLHSLQPGLTLPRRVFSRLVQSPQTTSPDSEEVSPALAEPVPETPTLASPVFPQPMVEPLRALSQDFLLPGAGDIPPDTVTLLETNTPFVEAYLVGLNHEMGRELVWREFPNDQRATYFQNFWPAAGTHPQIPPIHIWTPANSLGENFQLGGGEEKLVLLVRGQLLLRYPDAIIYAVRAASPTKLGKEERHPLFRGRMEPDITYIGLDLTEEEARGEPGWYFVLQEQPTSPRFGLDVNRDRTLDPQAPLPGWDDLSWEDLRVPEGGHLRLEGASPVVQDAAGLQWGFNAAHQAAILRQRPARVAIHARLLLSPLPED